MEILISKRVAQKAIDFCEGKDIKDWLRSVGIEILSDNGKVLHIKGKVRTALVRDSDPVTVFCCLAFALFGVFWTFVCKDGLEIVKDYWKRKVKEEKEKKKGRKRVS